MSFSRTIVPALAAVLFSSSFSTAEDHSNHDHAAHAGHDHKRPDSHAPIGVMGAHTHEAGEIMLSYRFMQMSMKDMLNGTTDVTADEIIMPNGTYMSAPTEMTMTMHMIGAMYAPTNKLTIMAILNYLQNDMTSRRRMPMMMIDDSFDTSSSGLGDTSLGVLYQAHQDDTHSAIVGLALSIPTGSIDETDDTPMGANTHLPYAMQLGSGTYDLIPSATYQATYTKWSWGAQGKYILRNGTNDNDYTLGDRAQLTSWAAFRAHKNASLSLRLDFHDWGQIDGRDSKLTIMPGMNPNADENLTGGQRLDLGIGVNSVFGAHRISAEYLLPLQQDLNGPQMKLDGSFTLAYQVAF